MLYIKFIFMSVRSLHNIPTLTSSIVEQGVNRYWKRCQRL